MHELSVHASIQSRVPVSTVRMRKWTQHQNLNLCYYDVDYTSYCMPRAAAQTHRVMATFSLCLNVESIIRLWWRIDLTSHFTRGSVACLSRPLETHGTLRHSLSLWPGIYFFHPTSYRKYNHTHQLIICMLYAHSALPTHATFINLWCLGYRVRRTA